MIKLAKRAMDLLLETVVIAKKATLWEMDSAKSATNFVLLAMGKAKAAVQYATKTI